MKLIHTFQLNINIRCPKEAKKLNMLVLNTSSHIPFYYAFKAFFLGYTEVYVGV